MVFSSTKDLKYITRLDVEKNQFPDENFFIVKERELNNDLSLYSLYYCIGECLENEIVSLKREVYSHNELLKKNCQTYNDFISTTYNDSSIYRDIGFFKVINNLMDSLNFCKELERSYLLSYAKSYNGLIQDILPLNVIIEWDSFVKALESYDIVLVEDDHYSYWEDALFSDLIKNKPNLFDALLMETLNETDSLNERGHLLMSSGFYFLGHWQKELVSSAIQESLQVIPYDARDENCGVDIECNQRREHLQSQRIIQRSSAMNRIVVFAGGKHSQLTCTEGYDYMGCVMCKEGIERKIARLVVTKDLIKLYDCNGLQNEYQVSFEAKPSRFNYTIVTDRPSVIGIYNSDEYEEFKLEDMPEYLLYTDKGKKDVYIEPGRYTMMEFTLFGTLKKESKITIEK